MMVTKGIEIRLYPTKGQATMFNKNIGAARVAYNAAIRTKEELYRDYGITFIPKPQCMKDFYPWMTECDSRAILTAVRNADTAYKNWFRNLKKGNKKGHPKHKKKSNKGSYETTSMPKDPNKLFRKGGIFIPKCGVVKFRAHQDISKIKNIRYLTIKRTASGKYFCSICCDCELEQMEKTGAVVGLDLGVKDAIITSDGQKFENKKFLRCGEKRIKRLQRSVSRKRKGSKNRDKARTRLAIAYEKLGNKRKDYLQKMTTNLVRDYDVICIEDLNVQGMMKNHHLAKSIADVSFSMIRQMLTYKCKWYGKELVIINRWSPTSKTCNHCGHIMENFSLGIREWVCPECGTHHDRDINAAKNILDEGMRMMFNNRTGDVRIYACEEESSEPSVFSSSLKQELCASSADEVEHGI